MNGYFLQNHNTAISTIINIMLNRINLKYSTLWLHLSSRQYFYLFVECHKKGNLFRLPFLTYSLKLLPVLRSFDLFLHCGILVIFSGISVTLF